MRTIEIDLELHRAVESARGSFKEKEYEILKRLIGIGSSPAQAPKSPHGSPYRGEGIELPHGTQCLAEYRGQRVQAEIQNGKWVVKGKAHNGPSPALQSNVVTKSGKTTNLNGWNYWTVRRPNEEGWTRISVLRAEANPGKDLTLEELGLA